MKRMQRIARNTLFGIAALTFLSPAPVMGQPAAEEDGPPEEEVFDFEGDTVTTDFLKPNTMLVEGLRRGRASSLIAVRLDFVAEIVKSAEDI